MRMNNIRRSTISPLAQKIKAPQHLLRLKDEEDGSDNELDDRFRLPSLPRQNALKDDDILSNGNSAATSVSWSQEVESVATQKLEEQWTTVERTFYEEDNQLLKESILDECTQWRTQIPYLRIVGKNSTCDSNSSQRDIGFSDKKTKKRLDNSRNDDLFLERNLSMKEEEDSAQYKLNRAKFEDVLDMMTEYVISELFSNENAETDSLRDDLTDTLRIAPAPVHSNRNSSRNSKVNWTEEAISPNYIENKSISIRNRLLDTESSLQTIKNDANLQGIQKKSRKSISANKLRDFEDTEDDALKSKERLCTPHIGRNKLGTIFNERIVVSPVPFTVSTRESFSTVKTIPIKFMNVDLEISSGQGSARNIGFQSSAKKSGAFLRNPNIHSAWQTSVSPTVWPKNIRLAPIDTSRLPNSKNRSLAPSPAVQHCSRKSLSPISCPIIPKSANITRDCSINFLEIQGKHIVPSWDCSPKVAKSKKKIARAKERL
ncbi:PREDICTED: uncharacterized protein LOC108779601 [Cyphomyrmex costatus]|uniref:uncharacterized protein LOC108779601 n=1 Tax=Cyphomyrmex costatus TaxID=456900 RepID=UPI0008524106|nr:PREDICTED: uncharacterized protein LOC108779601 [Cyphomyrmex costatus]